MSRKKIENLSFEESLRELEEIVKQLETGELDLEDAMKMFERGLNLSQFSQEKLADAEQKIQLLMEKGGQEQLVSFDNNENDPK